MLPEDPMMLLSYVNTQLRDFYDESGRVLQQPGCVSGRAEKEAENH